MTGLQNFLKYSVFFGIIALLFTPFIVANNLFFPYITGKAYFFRVIVEIVFFLWLALAAYNPEYRPQKSFVLYGFVLFLISIFISDLNGVNFIASFWSNFERMEGYITLLHLFALFLVAGSVLKSEKDWKILFNISIFVSLIVAIISIKEIITTGENRVDSTFGNPIYLAVYMLFHVFLAAFYLLRGIVDQNLDIKKYYFAGIYAVIIILDIFVLFKTGTRGAILGLVGGTFISAFTILLTNFKNKNVRNLSLSIGTALLLVVATFLLVKDSDFVQNNKTLRRVANISITEGSAEARLINWQIAIQGIKERPLLGWGQDNYNLAFDKYYLPKMHGNESWFDRTHNIILDWLIAGGIFGLIFYLSIWFSAIYLIWNKNSKFSSIDKGILTGLLVAYFFHNLFVFDQIISYILFILIISYIHSQNNSFVHIFSKEILGQIKNYIAVVCVLLIPFSVYFINYESYEANIKLVDATKIVKKVTSVTGDSYGYYYENGGLNRNLELFNEALAKNTFANPEIRQQMIIALADTILKIQDKNADEVKQKFIEAAISELEKQITETKNDARFPYLLGSFYVYLKDINSAEKWLLEAVKLSPNKQVLRIPLIRAYMQFNQKEKALALAEETYNLDKSKDDLWIEYAKVVSVVDKKLFEKIVDQAISESDNNKIIQLFVSNIEKQPENVQARVSLAALYHRIGDDVAAVRVLDDTITRFPQNKYELNKFKQDIENGKI